MVSKAIAALAATYAIRLLHHFIKGVEHGFR
jgi:predicted MFS family arabinose efflux permease